MKVLCGVLSVLLAAQCVLATPYYLKPKHKQYHKALTQLVRQPAMPNKLDLCPTCIQFSEEALNALLNVILNSGVVGSCQALCSLLQQKVPSKAVNVVCNILCDVTGIKEFINIITKADLDPIWYCELLTACPVNDNGDCKITSLSVNPTSGPQGTFNILLEYMSKNGTGTGQIIVEVETQDGIPAEAAFLLEHKPAGTYDMNVQINAKPDPNCDPSQGPCEAWKPGNYPVTVVVCNGECGSKHPHSQIYDQGTTNFTITG